MSESQSFESHAKLVPAFHFFVLPVFLINIGWSIYRVVHAFSSEAVLSLVLAFAFMAAALTLRISIVTVQDRLIRLEMRLRLQRVLPAELQPKIPEFTPSQMIALRFASDAELPDLSRKVLQDKLTDRKAIKKLIRDWQPDYLRA